MKSFLILILTATVYVCACTPREIPGFKRLAKQNEQKTTRETEDAIKRSLALQDLHRVCTQEVPLPDGFQPVNKFGDLHRERYLGYGYHSQTDFETVKKFYDSYFAQDDWTPVKNEDSNWGYPEIGFRNERYKVSIVYAGRDGEINYFLQCFYVGDP